MILDTSAIIAILTKENEADAMIRAIEKHGPNPMVIAAPTYFETFTVMFSRYGEKGAEELENFSIAIGLVIEDFSSDLAHVACRAFTCYRKGKNGLNMGDCFAYALAKARNEPLLCKGNDFKHTDISTVHY